MIICWGINHTGAGVSERESFAVASTHLPDLLATYQSRAISSAVVLSTCNRTEWYTQIDSAGALESFLAAQAGLDMELLRARGYQFCGYSALLHLFRVASSLDSLVVGESQVLGQLKSAYDAGCSAGTVTHLLHKIFQRAFRVAKRVRETTGISERPVSVASVAVTLAAQILGDLRKCRALVIGTGEIGKLAATHLCSAEIGKLTLCNRTLEHATNFVGAENKNVEVVEWSAQEAALNNIDIVLVCAPVEWGADLLSRVQKARAGKPLFIIDLAVPRAVDPNCANEGGVYLYNLDDLETVSAQNIEARQECLVRAEEIVQAAARECWAELSQAPVGHVIASLHQKCELIRQQELARTLADLEGCDFRTAQAVEQCTRSIVAKILHDPIMELKSTELEESAPWLRRLFRLG